MTQPTMAPATLTERDFDGTVEAFRQALELYMKGDADAVMALFSQRHDVTLANPLGPPCVGPAEVDRAARAGAAPLKDGCVRGIEEVLRYSTPDLGYVVEIERTQARLPGSENMTPFALRVTMILRREGDTWKIAHRHADPITTARPFSSIVEEE